MTEITIGPPDDSDGDLPDDDGVDINSMLDQLEKVQERLQQNPQLAQMFGIDLPEFSDDQTDADGSDYPPLNAANLLEIANALEQYGRSDMSISELKERIENNPDKINQMIRQNA